MALFTTAALLLHLVEALLPPLLPFAPGAKMGLSNVVTLLAMVLLSYTDAYLVLLLRCFLGSVFAGNVSSLLYSLPAGVISLTVQLLLYHFLYRFLSVMSISFAGAAVHNAVQVAVASFTVQTNLSLMLPFMLLASVIAGLFVGIVAFFVIKYLPKKFYIDDYKKRPGKEPK
ncbi:MAG: Gx transporter family protein [Clostridiales bacterium]|nr:Gx transporter family protein [Clostridiales bacterium]